jgi:hypothetical protein
MPTPIQSADSNNTKPTAREEAFQIFAQAGGNPKDGIAEANVPAFVRNNSRLLDAIAQKLGTEPSKVKDPQILQYFKTGSIVSDGKAAASLNEVTVLLIAPSASKAPAPKADVPIAAPLNPALSPEKQQEIEQKAAGYIRSLAVIVNKPQLSLTGPNLTKFILTPALLDAVNTKRPDLKEVNAVLAKAIQADPNKTLTGDQAVELLTQFYTQQALQEQASKPTQQATK